MFETLVPKDKEIEELKTRLNEKENRLVWMDNRLDERKYSKEGLLVKWQYKVNSSEILRPYHKCSRITWGATSW